VHRYRFAARPGWLALHVITLALVVTMVLLGRWQLTVSDEKHFSLRNFGYAIQWWLFSLCALLMWGRLIRDRVRRDTAPGIAEPAPPGPAPVAYRRYVMPKIQDDGSDPVHAAYNAYLASLAAEDAKEGRP
jgi:hypothetical protein